ncbi:hypothetical protein AU190_00245 [Mycolicibacterium acapulense]|uniref:Sporulation protein n=1 Tax=Mycobacterium lehmannii TaxID=2048550 RepID=A0A101ADG2_9MYCO|nr:MULTISPECIES: hypothetical protein [Mycobacterium]KUI01075.1 hypothetical protein AU189_12085 [Mycolicibacterium acapulense]KUI06362.1 hypothetical protein AU190_00245 [Mycolicibacterium acapulense]KUI20966.1 hypothetical protein AU192_10890 [Mycobacterium lehmannii]OBB70810.1 hypothetical protein A5759_24185 [Mycobacterium sp. 852014-52144_SCH5372336]
MDLRPELLESLDFDPNASRVFGEPYETADGTTVLPVAEVRGRARRGGEPNVKVTSRPAGVFVIKDGDAVWRPAVDATRITLAGILVGLVTSALAGVAMVRRPPWPDLYGDISSR